MAGFRGTAQRQLRPPERIGGRSNRPAGARARSRRPGDDPGQPAGAPRRAAHRCGVAPGRAGAAARCASRDRPAVSAATSGAGFWAGLQPCRRRSRLPRAPIVPVLGVPHRIRRALDVAAAPVAISMARSGCAATPRICRAGCATILRHSLATSWRGAPGRLPRASAARSLGSACATPKAAGAAVRHRGNLSFSWRLIFAPEAVVDYVVAHEVAHLVEMNHGPRFWRLVDSLAPGNSAAARLARSPPRPNCCPTADR